MSFDLLTRSMMRLGNPLPNSIRRVSAMSIEQIGIPKEYFKDPKAFQKQALRDVLFSPEVLREVNQLDSFPDKWEYLERVRVNFLQMYSRWQELALESLELLNIAKEINRYRATEEYVKEQWGKYSSYFAWQLLGFVIATIIIKEMK